MNLSELDFDAVSDTAFYQKQLESDSQKRLDELARAVSKKDLAAVEDICSSFHAHGIEAIDLRLIYQGLLRGRSSSKSASKCP